MSRFRNGQSGFEHKDHYNIQHTFQLIDLPKIFGLYLSGRLPLDDLVGERFTLEAVNEAYARLVAGGLGRSVLVP